jgi:hypothetical protein
VLDYKIIDLCTQIEPREKDIIMLKLRRKEMKVELKGYEVNTKDLESEYHAVILRICGKIREKLTNEWRKNFLSNIKRLIKHSLLQLQKDQSEIFYFKVKLIAVHHKFQSMSIEPPDIKQGVLPQFTETALLLYLDQNHDNETDFDKTLNELEVEQGRKRTQLEKTIQMLEYKLMKEGDLRFRMAEKLSEEGAILTQYYS